MPKKTLDTKAEFIGVTLTLDCMGKIWEQKIFIVSRNFCVPKFFRNFLYCRGDFLDEEIDQDCYYEAVGGEIKEAAFL